MFDDIFDELYLSEELWQDASKISLPSDVVTAAATETKTTEMPANIVCFVCKAVFECNVVRGCVCVRVRACVRACVYYLFLQIHYHM